jgi:hypothetical protein
MIIMILFINYSSTYGFFRKYSYDSPFMSSSSSLTDSPTATSNAAMASSVTADPATTSSSSTSSSTVIDDNDDNKKKSSVRPNIDHLIKKEERVFKQARSSSYNAADDDDEEGLPSQHEDLIFEGTFEYESELLPLSTTSSPRDLLNFFLNPNNRDLVIKGGGNPTETIPPSRELYDEWTSQSQVVDSTPPDGRDEEILAVYSDVHIAPGLSISAVSYTGCKVLTDPRNSLPFYEFTLVKEDYEGKGSRPMVWVFNRITGKTPSSKQQQRDHLSSSTKAAVAAETTPQPARGHDGSSRTYALSRVTIERDTNEEGCRVCYYGHVKVVSKLPKGLLNILPLPKRSVEAKVSKSIVNQLEKEGIQSIDKFRDALKRFADSQQRNVLSVSDVDHSGSNNSDII